MFKSFLGKIILFSVMLHAVSVVHAEIYTWTDDKGKKYFGDSIPDKYKKTSNKVIIKNKAPSKEDAAQTQKRAHVLLLLNMKMQEELKQPLIKAKFNTKPKKKYASKLDKEWALYKESKTCFSQCQVVTTGQSWRDAYGRIHPTNVYDNSACGHCTERAQPTLR